jgi:hypothetical protein
MVCKMTRTLLRWGCGLCATWIVLAAPIPAFAQEDDNPAIQQWQIEQAQRILEQTKKLGPWETQAQVIEDATNNMFQQQGWNSESDQFSRDVLREVSKIPPWKTAERQEVLMNALQARLGLSHDQRTQLNRDMQKEATGLTIKYFKDLAPIAMEVARTRMADKPFTPEQVQSWSQRLMPMMDDALQSLQRVSSKLEETMTPEQREKFKTDMDAVLRRHKDVAKMMVKWQAGNWTPTDWGLQNDPIHAGAVQLAADKEAQKNALVEAAQVRTHPDELKIAVDESTWDKYVKWFCATYECTDVQRGKADNVLKSSKDEAVRYHSSKRDLFENAQRLVRAGADDEHRKAAAAELARLQAPIAQMFERLRKRLYEEILTTQQRQMRPLDKTPLPPQKTAAAQSGG